MNKIFKLKVFRPFNNRRGSSNSLFMGIVVAILLVSTISFLIARGSESFVQARLDTITYKITDAVASSGEINEGIQKELFKDYDKLKFYTGDYTVEMYKYNYKTYFNKEFVGSSSNGSVIPTIPIEKGYMVQVIYKCEETTLDKIVTILNGDDDPVGMASESSAKVE